MTTRFLVVVAFVVSALWAQQSNAIYPIAQQNMDRIQREMRNQGNVTRTDLQPSDLLPKEDNSKTDVTVGACMGLKVLGTGLSGCVDVDGDIDLNAGIGPVQFDVYGNPKTANVGGCVGVGGSVLQVGPINVVSGSARRLSLPQWNGSSSRGPFYAT